MNNTYYLLMVVTTPINAAQKQALKRALLSFGRKDDDQPYRITRARPRLDGQACLFVITVDGTPSKADFMAALAAELGISVATLNANTTFTRFAGATVTERADAARDFLVANNAAWEPAE